MNRALISNIFSSFADKAFTTIAMLAATLILVRVLPRSDYGIIGIVVGYAIFVQLLSLPLENAILRDHKKYYASIEKYLLNYLAFNLLKGVVFIIIGAVLAIVLPVIYGDNGFFWAVLSMVVVIIGDSIISPFIIYASTQYKQSLVTVINMVRYSLNVLLLLGLLVLPEHVPMLSYVLVKDIVIYSIIIVIWIVAIKKYLAINFSKLSIVKEFDPKFIWNTLSNYSLWVHLTGVVTNFIYRADTLFLSFFSSLDSVGNYNIALNTANFANIAPSILGYHNSVAISHSETSNDSLNLTNKFLRASIYLGILMIVGYLALGTMLLKTITGDDDVENIYLYMICIVSGLIAVKTFASPFVAYINIKGDVKKLFYRVNLPTLLFTAIVYLLAVQLYGAIGLAMSNIVVAIFWISLLMLEMKKYGYHIPQRNEYLQDFRALNKYLFKINL